MLINIQDTRTLTTTTVNEVTEAVISTMGPDGHVVLCDVSGVPTPTKDGSSVAKAMRFEEPNKNLIARLISEGCSRTDDECGDGTTTTAFYLNRFYNQFVDNCNFKTKKRLNELVQETLTLIKARSVAVDIDSKILKDVMLTTSNSDEEMVDFVLDIYRKNPHLPNFMLRKGTTDRDEVQDNGSCSWVGGFANPAFSPNGTGSPVTLSRYLPVVVSGEISVDTQEQIEQLNQNLATAIKQNKVVVLIGRGINQRALETLNKFNYVTKGLNVIAIDVRASGSSGVGIVGDIATALGVAMRTTIHEDLPEYHTDYQVSAELTISGSRITLTQLNNLHDVRVAQAVENVKAELNSLTAEQRNAAIGKIIAHRYSVLSGGDIVVYVGGLSGADINERTTRIQDVGRVCQSALRAGVLEGCGYTLAVIGDELKAKYPEDIIAQQYAEVLQSQVKFLMGEWSPNMDFVNLATGDTAKRPKDINVWDATLATCSAIEAGMKIAILLMDTSNIIMNSKLADVRIGM